jgi:hypothetical protein
MLVGSPGKLQPSGSSAIWGDPGEKLAKSLALVGAVGGVTSTRAGGGGFLDGDVARQYPEMMTSHSEVPSTGARGGGGVQKEPEEPAEPGVSVEGGWLV